MCFFSNNTSSNEVLSESKINISKLVSDIADTYVKGKMVIECIRNCLNIMIENELVIINISQNNHLKKCCLH